jgi:peptide/nickel transport system permease protein
MKQRVAIAIAIANKPEVIVADEPTTALDVTVQADVLHLLAELCEQHGTALLFISHDFGVVSELCERVAVMYAGRIMEVGPTDAVLAHPANPYTSNLIACVPVLGTPDRPLHAIEGQPPPIDSLPPGCAFADRCPIVEDRCRVGDIDLQPLGPGRASRCVKPLWTAPEGASA